MPNITLPLLPQQKYVVKSDKKCIQIKEECALGDDKISNETNCKLKSNNVWYEPFRMEVTCEDGDIIQKENEVESVEKRTYKKKKVWKKYKTKHLDALYIKSELESSDEDVPLSNIKNSSILDTTDCVNNEKIGVSTNKISIVKQKKLELTKQERRERRRLKRERRLQKLLRNSNLTVLKTNRKNKQKKVYQYKNGKKIFCKSDTESSDFEKYIYFDESKTKRKIKVNSDLSIEDLETQIKAIKIENICLMKEHSRIDELKLRERLKLRMEIKRLKADIMDLQLEEYPKSQLIPEIGNTAVLIEILQKHLEEADYSIKSPENVKDLFHRLESFPFTDSSFWKGFNTIESTTNGVSPTPFWTGNLDTISPDTEIYFKPDEILMKSLLNIENQPHTNFLWDKKYSGYSKRSNPDVFVIGPLKNGEIPSGDDLKHSPNSSFDSEHCNSDWNKAATKLREKKLMIEQKRNEKCDFNEDVDDCDVSIKEENNDNNACDDDAWHDGDLHHENSYDEPTAEEEIENSNELNNELADNVASIEEDGGLCTECGHNVTWSSFISRHRDAHGKGVKVTPCNNCNMRFLKSGHFDGRHRLKRPPPKKFRTSAFMCEQCGVCCTSLSGLTQHRLRHAEARHACPHCPYRCRRKGYLKKHIELHTRKPHRKQTFRKPTEKNPEEYHQTYLCDFCDHAANSAQALKRHRNTHTSKKTFPCPNCPYVANKLSRLTQHTKTHSGEKPYQCGYCDYKSSCKSYLKSHIRYHTGEKPHKCEQCPYQCVTTTRLKIHKRIHSGERSYACTLCQYRGTTNFNLKVHLRQHDKEKTLKCDICDYVCSSLGKLATHSKMHEEIGEHKNADELVEVETR